VTSLRRPWLGLVGLVLLAACATSQIPSPSAPPASPSVQPSAAEPTPVSTGPVGPSPAASAGSSAVPTQTDTDWGRIWDALPAGFPIFPGSIPTETGEGPVSASLAVAASPQEVGGFMQTALTSAGYSFESFEGPSEDGSYTLSAVGATDAACRVQVRLTPLSGTTVMTVLYAAACPFD
jgi:hypothetical protein